MPHQQHTLTPRKDPKHSSTTATAPPSTLPAEPAASPAAPTLQDILQPPHPALRDGILEGWSYPAIAKWMSAFDDAIQASPKDIPPILQPASESSCVNLAC